MKREHTIRPDFVIDNIRAIKDDPLFATRRETLASPPLRLVIPGLSSLRTNPIAH
jgi:hypothetical protein